jgi:hypothetical protein
VFTKDGIHTLANIFSVDPTQVDLLPRFCATQRFYASNTTQAKERNYHNQHPTNQYLLLGIEVFGCPHKQADVFLHDYANAIRSLKGPQGLHFFVLVTFIC